RTCSSGRSERGVHQLGQRYLRTCPDVGDDLGWGHGLEPAAGSKVRSAAQTEEKSGRVQISGAGRVDERLDWMSVDDVDLVAPDDHRASRAPREGRDLAVLASVLERSVEVVDLVQRADLGLIGEQDVDVALDELEERVPMTVHAKGIGQRERDDPPTQCARPPNDAPPTLVFAAERPDMPTPGPMAS